MSFNKIRMGQEELFTTVVEDQDGRKIEEWKVMKRDFPKVVEILFKKFGLKRKQTENEDRDLDWIKR